jgi:hypothetical protein
MTTSATALPANSVPEVRNGSRRLCSMSMRRNDYRHHPSHAVPPTTALVFVGSLPS